MRRGFNILDKNYGVASGMTGEPDLFQRQFVHAWQAETGYDSRYYVRWIQQALNNILGFRLAVDGILGPKTRYAIRTFQARFGLAEDGIVGPKTERALIQAGAGNPPSVTVPAQPLAYPPASATDYGETLRKRIVRIALTEQLRWGNGNVKESDPRILAVLEDYWVKGVGSLPAKWRSLPWSAAFVSWVMRKAGAGGSFKYASGHTTYVAHAKRNRLANNTNPFKAYRITEVAPRAGDLVCLERQDGRGNWSGVTYDNVDDGNFRASHTDIVTKAVPGKLIAVGGNVSNSVKQKGVSINSQGLITMPRYYAVVRIG